MADAWGILMMLFFLSHECFAQFALDPDGVVRVCTGQNQQFMCTSGGGAWTISGFGNGISDATQATASLYAPSNIRVTTTDDTTISNPTTLTFMMLGYPDDNARVTCTDITGSSMITSTIRIAPTNCTRIFMVLNTTSSTITIKLAVSNCDGSMPSYRVTARSVSSGVATTALNIMSTVYLMSSLEADTAYDVELVDMECLNVILDRLSIRTEVDLSTDPNTSSNSSNSTNSPDTALPPGPIAGIVIVVLIIIIVAATAIIVLIIFFYWKKKQGKRPIAEPMTAHSNREEMQDRKEQNKEEQLTYVVADFSKAPPTESNKPKKEEPVQYTGVQFPHP